MTSVEAASAALASSDVFALVGRTLHERVRIDRVVAEGGFGVVYAGEHLALGVPVAVKVLKSDDGELVPPKAFVEQFVREARTIARVRHPNIVQVLDVATVEVEGGSVPYMVLEWCDGLTLDRWLDRRGEDRAMTAREAWALLRPVADAIATAHDAGVAHRDVKPGNVMVIAAKKGAVAKVLDFGIAKLMNGESAGSGVTATQSTMRAYSPQYAAPEQVAGTRTGPWTDVHALALLFVELVLGVAAYRSDSRQWLLQEIMSNVRPTVAHHGLSLGTMDAVIEKALAFVPETRYANAGEFVAAMDDVLSRPGVSDSKGSPLPSKKYDGNVEPTVDADPRAHNVTGPRVSARAQQPPERVHTVRDDTASAPVVDTIAPERERPSRPAPGRNSRAALFGAVALGVIVSIVGISTRNPSSSGAQRAPTLANDAGAGQRSPSMSALLTDASLLTLPAAQPRASEPDADVVRDAAIDASRPVDVRSVRRTPSSHGSGARTPGGYRLE